MKNLVFAGVVATALIVSAPAANASDSVASISGHQSLTNLNSPANGARRGGIQVPGGGNYGSRAIWHGVRNVPGGYSSYRRPFRGFILPVYWINRGFSVNNYSAYGLRAPTNGYYWSRYYDDAVLTNPRGYVYDSVSNVPWGGAPSNYGPAGNQQPVYAPRIDADRSVYDGEDLPANSTTEAGTYEGQWTGAYVDPQKQTYRGEWQGTYKNENGQTYEGTYRGTSTGAPVYAAGTGNQDYGYTDADVDADRDGPIGTNQQTAYSGAPYQAPGYQASGYQAPAYQQAPGGYERYEKCLRSRGIAGGAIGAIIGAVAGNRIAGRGNRLAGSLIGGGLGGIAGLGVEKLVNKCEKYLPRQEYRPQYRPAAQGYYPPQGYGWYYQQQPQQAAVTTVTIVPGNTVTTTTTTEEVIYENVYSRASHKGKGLRRPAPSRKRCGC